MLTTPEKPNTYPSTEHAPIIRKNARECGIEIDNKTIETSCSVKYLELTFNRNVRFNDHVKRTINKTTIVKSQLSRLMRNKNISQQSKSQIYTQAIRPVLSYASPVWLNPSYLSSCQAEEIRKCERACLCNISGLYRRSNGKHFKSEVLYKESEIIRIDYYMANLNINPYQKCNDSDDKSLNHIVKMMSKT